MTRVSLVMIFIGTALTGCTASPKAATPPVLDKISFNVTVDQFPVIHPEFHFHSADGNVIALHRDLLATTAPKPITLQEDMVVAIPPDQQRKGAVYVGAWPCGPEIYTADLQAYLLDARGNHSNVVNYRISCDALE